MNKVLGILLFALSAAAPAAETHRGGVDIVPIPDESGRLIPLYSNSYALVIGISSNQPGFDHLPQATQDAREVSAALERRGFQVRTALDVTHRAFMEQWADFATTAGAQPESRLLVYFAGHGRTVKLANGEDYGSIVLADTPSPALDRVGYEQKAVPFQFFYDEAKLLPARHVLFLFDSCFSGSLLASRSGTQLPEAIRDHVRYPVRLFITAGTAYQTVPDQSVFKDEFVKLLEGRAPDANRDGYLTGRELSYLLYERVKERTAGAQSPQDLFMPLGGQGNLKGDFVFLLEDAP